MNGLLLHLVLIKYSNASIMSGPRTINTFLRPRTDFPLTSTTLILKIKTGAIKINKIINSASVNNFQKEW